MTCLFSKMERQQGGLYTGVIPYNADDPIYQGVFSAILEASTEAEAKGHNARFDPVGFQKVLQALAKKNSAHSLRPVEALIFVAGWDMCRPIFIGANLNNRAVSLRTNGKSVDADYSIYSEDVCLLRKELIKLKATQPAGAWFPEGGIGKHFVQLCMRHYAERGLNGDVFPLKQLFEYAVDNTNIIRLQRSLGAELGAGNTSGLFRLNGLTSAIYDTHTIPIEPLYAVLPDGSIDRDNFVLPLESDNGRQLHYTSVTRNISSFTGKDVFQCEMVTGGEPWNEKQAKIAAASALKAANRIIQEDREERAAAANYQPSPLIPIDGTIKEQFEALFSYNGSEVASRFKLANDGDEVIFNVHVKDNPVLAQAMREMAPERWLGSKLMQTGSLDLTAGMREAGTLETAKRLRLIGARSSRTCFDLAA